MSEQEKKVLAAAGRNDLLEAWAVLDAENSEVLRKKSALWVHIHAALAVVAEAERLAELRRRGYVLLEGTIWVRRSSDPKYVDVYEADPRHYGPRGHEMRLSDGGKKGTKGGRHNLDPALLKRALEVTT